MKYQELINKGILVSPITQKKLVLSENESTVVTDDGLESYPIINKFNTNIPILLPKENNTNSDLYELEKEYQKNVYLEQESMIDRLRIWIRGEYRAIDDKYVFSQIFKRDIGDPVYLSVGGGPHRQNNQLINMNIGPFYNVDIVGDAHYLPFSNDSVDAIFCEAVIEHLQNPNQVVSEMYRVLKKKSKLFSAVPFMQAYHGYPHHFQNYTLTGHKYLYEKAGFKIIESGTLYGPMMTMASLIKRFIEEYLPAAIKYPLLLVWKFIGNILLRPLDIIFNKRKNAYVLASETYVIAEKQ